MNRQSRLLMEDRYAEWLAETRGISVDEAWHYASRPRRWVGHEPAKPQPILYTDNVVPFARPRRPSQPPEAA